MEQRPLERDRRLGERPEEPPEGWAALLQAKQRRELLGELAFVVCVLVVTAVLTALTWPRTLVFLVTGGIALLGSGLRLRRMTPHARRQHRDEALDRLRIESAVRRHVSVGARLRPEATDHAEEIRTFSRLGLVGWPLLAGVLAVQTVVGDRLWEQLATGAGALLCLAALVRSRRRDRWARRWLADPLPRA